MSDKDLANATFEFFMESQFWAREHLVDFQRNQLAQLLRHAKAHVPFYAHRLDAVVMANGDINWERWQEIPILTRKDVAENTDALQARELPPGHGPVAQNSTSGTTGLPIDVRYPEILLDVCKAADWRAHTWWKLDWSKTSVLWTNYNAQQKAYGPDRSYGSWGPKGNSAKGQSYIADLDMSHEERIAHLRDKGASYLSSQGGSSYAAALALQLQGKMLPLDAVCSHGGNFGDDDAPVYLAAFGAQLHAIYSSNEGGRMAHTCATCGQYHVNAEAVLIEILRENGEPCVPGEIGRVIVTPFFNTAQPFIRYEQGDLAAWSTDFTCPVTLPSLSGISGRLSNLFKHMNGTPFMPLIPDTLREDLSAQFWQFAQVSKDTIEVRYKPINETTPQREAAFADQLRVLLQDNYKIKFVHINAMPLTSSGKYLKYSYETNMRHRT